MIRGCPFWKDCFDNNKSASSSGKYQKSSATSTGKFLILAYIFISVMRNCICRRVANLLISSNFSIKADAATCRRVFTAFFLCTYDVELSLQQLSLCGYLESPDLNSTCWNFQEMIFFWLPRCRSNLPARSSPLPVDIILQSMQTIFVRQTRSMHPTSSANFMIGVLGHDSRREKIYN